MKTLSALALCLTTANAWSLVSTPVESKSPTAAVLTSAAGVSLAGSPESVSLGQSHWTDGSRAAASAASEVSAGKTPQPQLPASSKAKKVSDGGLKVPGVSRGEEGAFAGGGIGFMTGFIAVETPALIAGAVPIVGKLVGGILAVALFVPAVLVGLITAGIGACVGSAVDRN